MADRSCAFCEDEFPEEKFRRIEGWWIRPYPDIEWDGFEDMPPRIFVKDEPEKGSALLCPNGCLFEKFSSGALRAGSDNA